MTIEIEAGKENQEKKSNGAERETYAVCPVTAAGVPVLAMQVKTPAEYVLPRRNRIEGTGGGGTGREKEVS